MKDKQYFVVTKGQIIDGMIVPRKKIDKQAKPLRIYPPVNRESISLWRMILGWFGW